MQVKKNPHAVLENYTKILWQLGLVLSLFIVYELIEMKSYPSEVVALSGNYVIEDDTPQNIEVKPIEVPVKPTKAVLPDKIVKVEDEEIIVETVIESTETDESEAVVITDITAVEEEEEIVEDVPFVVIEEVPVYPGCKGSNKQLRNCFSSEITKFVARTFNAQIASDIGLQSGTIQKIFVVFRINSKGEITDIKARAPKKELKQEAIRVIGLLPQMTPGKQRGKPVGVSYGLPIVFEVR